MAGETARAKARRLKQVAGPGQRGAEGEETTGAALMALPPSWVVLDELDWPGRRFTNIDHVVIGPPGVFVIDTKSWSGRVVVRNGVVSQGGRDRSTAVWGAAAAAASVADLVPSLRSEHVHGVVCLADIDARVDWVDGVLVSPANRLVGELTGYAEVLPGGLARAVAVDVARRLRPVEQAPRPSRRKRRPFAVLVVAVLLMAVAVALVTQPDVLTSWADDLVDLVP